MSSGAQVLNTEDILTLIFEELTLQDLTPLASVHPTFAKRVAALTLTKITWKQYEKLNRDNQWGVIKCDAIEEITVENEDTNPGQGPVMTSEKVEQIKSLCPQVHCIHSISPRQDDKYLEDQWDILLEPGVTPYYEHTLHVNLTPPFNTPVRFWSKDKFPTPEELCTIAWPGWTGRSTVSMDISGEKSSWRTSALAWLGSSAIQQTTISALNLDLDMTLPEITSILAVRAFARGAGTVGNSVLDITEIEIELRGHFPTKNDFASLVLSGCQNLTRLCLTHDPPKYRFEDPEIAMDEFPDLLALIATKLPNLREFAMTLNGGYRGADTENRFTSLNTIHLSGHAPLAICDIAVNVMDEFMFQSTQIKDLAVTLSQICDAKTDVGISLYYYRTGQNRLSDRCPRYQKHLTRIMTKIFELPPVLQAQLRSLSHMQDLQAAQTMQLFRHIFKGVDEKWYFDSEEEDGDDL